MEGRMGLQTDPILQDHSLYCCRSNLYLLILQCKIDLLCFTLIQVPCFWRLIVFFLVYFVWIFENQVFNVSITQLTQSFFATCSKFKKTAQIQDVSTSKQSSNQLFCPISLFSMPRKHVLYSPTQIHKKVANVKLNIVYTNVQQSKTPIQIGIYNKAIINITSIYTLVWATFHEPY